MSISVPPHEYAPSAPPVTATTAARPERGRARWLALATLAVALGALVRGVHVFSADFPLNDGALFAAMVEDLKAAEFRLPATTRYNGLSLPYAYSPLPFYVAAALSTATGLSSVELLRWLPWLVASATVGAFLLLARALLANRVAVLVATIAFATAPRAFIWMIMGGGLTRSFGFLFALLTIHQLHATFTRRRWAHAILAGVCAGLVLLSHIGTAPFVAVSGALLLAVHGRHRFGLTASIAAAAIAAAVSSPWWLSVLATHGVAPFAAAGRTGGNVLSGGRETIHVLGKVARLGNVTSEPLFPLLSALGLLGTLVAVATRRPLLPLWLLLILLFDARQGDTFSMVPLAMLVGIGVTEGVMPLFRRRASDGRHPGRWQRLLPAAAGGGAFAYVLLGALLSDADFAGEAKHLVPLSAEERAAMQWVATHTPAESRVFVAPQVGWAVDRTQEWFPLLARRVSPVTVQGTEWLPDGAFARAERHYRYANECAWGGGAGCLEALEDSLGTSFTHVYLPRRDTTGCCAALITALRDRRDEWRLAYAGKGALVFERTGGGAMAGVREPAAPRASASPVGRPIAIVPHHDAGPRPAPPRR